MGPTAKVVQLSSLCLSFHHHHKQAALCALLELPHRITQAGNSQGTCSRRCSCPRFLQRNTGYSSTAAHKQGDLVSATTRQAGYGVYVVSMSSQRTTVECLHLYYCAAARESSSQVARCIVCGATQHQQLTVASSEVATCTNTHTNTTSTVAIAQQATYTHRALFFSPLFDCH